MLASFRVPIVLSGETSHLLVQDVPACVFWQGYPDPEVEAREGSQAQAAWFRHVLIRATVRPPLDLDWVLSWGDDYWPPLERYLEAIGFFPRPVVAAVAAGALLDLDPAPGHPRESLADQAAFRGCVPPPHVQHIFRLVARSIGVRASQLWLGWASEFFFDYHVHLSDEDKAGAPLPE